MSKNLIGIISYLPDDMEIRKNRWKLLNNLISKCQNLFNLPIFIIIQNWTEAEIVQLNNNRNITLSDNYKKLGITGARKLLRKFFINSDYDNLIMLDDDCIIKGTYEQATKYLKQIEENPNCFIEFNGTLLKLFCISKEIFKEVNFENINPEDGDGFEDRIFVTKLRKLYSDKRREFKDTGIEEESISTKDPNSTWYKNQDIKKMLENTNKILC